MTQLEIINDAIIMEQEKMIALLKERIADLERVLGYDTTTNS